MSTLTCLIAPPDVTAGFEAALLEAAAFGRSGNPAAGLGLLLRELSAALDAQEAGRPWGRRMADQWRRAIENYRREFLGAGYGMGVER